MQFNSIWPIDRTLFGASTPGQILLGSDGNEGVFDIPQSSSITGTFFESYLRHSLGRVLHLCREVDIVFYSSSWLGRNVEKRPLLQSEEFCLKGHDLKELKYKYIFLYNPIANNKWEFRKRKTEKCNSAEKNHLFIDSPSNIYIVIHRQTVSFYQNSSVWLDPQDARSRDRNPSNFTID